MWGMEPFLECLLEIICAPFLGSMENAKLSKLGKFEEAVKAIIMIAVMLMVIGTLVGLALLTWGEDLLLPGAIVAMVCGGLLVIYLCIAIPLYIKSRK